MLLHVLRLQNIYMHLHRYFSVNLEQERAARHNFTAELAIRPHLSLLKDENFSIVL